ncbi:MAG: YihY family inner membrane protein [Gammaproteobacteria bacterium]|nr:YihY family inner membrane protein [Gammaproteobacteria bacterium]MDH5803214.1 YihY family inner membrane protein [Gammaproteobacteria bacterium]
MPLSNPQIKQVIHFCLRWFRRFWCLARDVYYHFRRVHCFDLAASLAYTTLLSLVPLLVVILSVLSILPLFDQVPAILQDFVFRNFVPSTGQVLQDYLTQFAAQTENLTGVGGAVLVVTAFLLMHAVHETVNTIWQVGESRPLYFSVLLYAGVLTLGPVLIVVGIGATSYVLTLPLIDTAASLGAGLKHFLPFAFSVVGMTLVYKFVPNAPVLMRHALIGGAVAAMLFELAKRAFAWYLLQFPTYEIVYGAVSVIPIFLLWLYISWVIALGGAVLVFCLGKAGDVSAPT